MVKVASKKPDSKMKNKLQAVQYLVKLYEQNGNADYIGEAVSQEQHALQAAAQAEKHDPKDSELILAALLHDIGHMLGMQNNDKEMMGDCGVMSHEKIGAEFATKDMGLSARIGSLIKSHVDAKRYLCWKDPRYHSNLSEASKTTLTYQGGPMKRTEAVAWEMNPDFENFLRMRKWDEAAKDPNAKVPPFSAYLDRIHTIINRNAAKTKTKDASSNKTSKE